MSHAKRGTYPAVTPRAAKRGRPAGPTHSTRSIRLPDALWAALELRAEREDQTVNALVRAALENLIHNA